MCRKTAKVSSAKPPYNAPRFKVRQYDFDVFAGPAAGEKVEDFRFRGLDGSTVRLSDYRGKWVVLETGSANLLVPHRVLRLS